MQQLQDLTQIIERLTLAGSFKEASNLLVEWAREFTGCQSTILRLVMDSQGEAWMAGCATNGASESFVRDEGLMPVSDCLCGRVSSGNTDTSLPFFTERGAFVCNRMSSLPDELPQTEDWSLRGRCLAEEYESVAICPVRSKDDIVGSLHLADFRPGVFNDNIEVVEAACRVAGTVLLGLRDEERDKSLLETIQTALMPPVPPSIEGVSIGVSFSSATEMARLGGDFYDVIDLGARGVLIVVGDVCGKGLQAAGMAAQARYAIGARATQATGLASFLASANKELLRILPAESFVAAVACLIDIQNKKVHVCLAGHPSPIHFASGCSTEMEAPHNPPLGFFANIQFHEASADLHAGDTLLIYTDGVTDSRRDSSTFGVDGILRALDGASQQDTERLSRAVCQQATEFHDQSLAGDDRLVMAIRID
jgi:serine phosphatase RsbU (regulator of sigma subunit)